MEREREKGEGGGSGYGKGKRKVNGRGGGCDTLRPMRTRSDRQCRKARTRSVLWLTSRQKGT